MRCIRSAGRSTRIPRLVLVRAGRLPSHSDRASTGWNCMQSIATGVRSYWQEYHGGIAHKKLTSWSQSTLLTDVQKQTTYNQAGSVLQNEKLGPVC